MMRLLSLAALLLALLMASTSAPLRAAPSGIGHLQLIHNAPDAGPVDVYLDGRRVWDDARFLTATAFLEVFAGEMLIEVVPGGDLDNRMPIWSGMLSVHRDLSYVAALSGSAVAKTTMLQIKEDVRRVASSGNAEFFLMNGLTNTGLLDLRRLNPLDNASFDLLANNVSFGHISDYIGLPAGGHNLELTNADNTERYAVFHLTLHRYRGRTLVCLLAGEGTGPNDGLTLIAFDVNGTPLLSAVITGTDEAGSLPNAFTLTGAYPNPFQTTTTLTFDLPEAATVHVTVHDLLGRRVLDLAPRRMEAGRQRRLNVPAGRLAAGTYLYRVVAHRPTHTTVRTGTLTRLK